MSDAITVSDLNVSFGTSHVVRDVGFTVREGESYGIVGESGSGKSTILRALSGLNRAWSGAITIGGEKQQPKRPPAFYRRVQMVFQDPYGSLHPRMTVDATLAEPVAIHGLGDADRRINARSRMSASMAAFASAIRTSFPAASASAWRLPGR